MSMKPKEFKEKLKGIIHLVMTPFDKHDELDEQALRAGLRNVCDNFKGTDITILALGSTGEFYAMTEAENKRAIEIVTEEVNGNFPVLIGTGRAGTKLTCEVSKFAQNAGADAVLVIPPYYLPANEEGILNHYKAVADSIDIALTIYNNPTPTNTWLNARILKKLSKIENLVGLKENTTNLSAFRNIIRMLDPEDISIFCGTGHFTYQFMCYLDCPGFVTELLNFAPHLALDLLNAGREKNSEKINKTIDKIMLIWDWVGEIAVKRCCYPVVSPVGPDTTFYQDLNKVAMELTTGIPCGRSRLPMSNLSNNEIEELKGILLQMGCTLA